ncbi:hypothetical protein [Stenotrophomonas sp. PS02300]|uniref:hypothetical protein n=1 Tax=Stenotrophomonas sp. PS02300 TaxID=2991426 RepID=UPI00249C181F|nr:hypothetical protein [Stenotrophomonas sp. PS02300]
MKTYTICVIGPVGISYWLPLDSEEAAPDAIARIFRDDPKNVAETMKKCAAYELENIERELTYSDGTESGQEVLHYCLSIDQRMALEFESTDAVGGSGIELRGDGLASRDYSFEAESLDDAIKQFDALTNEKLNAPRWDVGSIDLEGEVLVWDKPYGVDGDILFDIAGHLETTL